MHQGAGQGCAEDCVHSEDGWRCLEDELRRLRRDGGAGRMDGGAMRMDGGALRTEGTCTDMGRWTSNWQLEGQLLC